jgi:hypothetical protein
VLGLASFASAQPAHLQPGSVLVFPLFDSQPASATVISVTNTNTSNLVCDNFFRAGDVRLHYVYVSEECQEFDVFEDLTPGDTLSVLASEHNPEGERGYLFVVALDPEQVSHIDFDFLIGSAYVANSNLDIMWSYTPYPFEGLGLDASAVDVDLGCATRRFIRGTSYTGPINFDGIDYEEFPDILYIDSFFQENDGVFDNQLTLMSCGGSNRVNVVDFLFYNNDEDAFSRTFNFICWTSVELSEISAITAGLGGDPDEFVKETGWARINGREIRDLAGNVQGAEGEPSLLGTFVQIVRSDFTAGHALHYSGTQNTCVLGD